MVFHLSEHFLENSEKLTEASGCFFLSSSGQVCTKNAYEDILPLSFLGSPCPCLVDFPPRRHRVAQCRLARACPGAVSMELNYCNGCESWLPFSSVDKNSLTCNIELGVELSLCCSYTIVCQSHLQNLLKLSVCGTQVMLLELSLFALSFCHWLDMLKRIQSTYHRVLPD